MSLIVSSTVALPLLSSKVSYITSYFRNGSFKALILKTDDNLRNYLILSRMPIAAVTPCIMSVQYTGGCSVQCGDTMMSVGDIMSTVGGVQYTRGIP